MLIYSLKNYKKICIHKMKTMYNEKQVRKTGKQTIVLYALKLYSDVCQLFPNKTGKKNYMLLDKKQNKAEENRREGS